MITGALVRASLVRSCGSRKIGIRKPIELKTKIAPTALAIHARRARRQFTWWTSSAPLICPMP